VAGAVVRIGGRFGGPAQRIGGIQTLGWAPVTIRSGHDGCFTVDGLPTGQIEFLVHAPGHAPYTRHFDLLGHTRNEVTIRLCTGAALRGRVTDAAGGPIPGARITVGSFGYVLAVTTTSSASGRFDLRGLDPRRMRLTVSAAGFATFVGEYSARPGALLQIHVALVPEQIFRGRLLTPDTTPLPGWLVLLRGRSGGRLVTGEDGRFRGTIAQAKTSLRISPPDPRRFVECDWLGEVAVKGDELEIRVPSELLPSARVRGSLLQRDGQPAPRATVVLECDATPVQTLRVDITDGGFRLGPVTPGEYELRWSAESASGPTFGRRGLRLNAGELELGVLRIDGDDAIRAGWVDVQLQRSDGGRIESPSAYLYDHQGRGLGSIPLDGKAHGRQALPPGAYELSVLSDNSQWIRKRFSIEAGADAQLRLSLAPATRRYILFPWPIPAAWDKVTRVRYVIEDNRGTVLDADDLGAEDLPFMYMPGLQSGVHRVKLTTDDGRRYAGTFAVEGLGKSSRPIVIGVELAQ
jgi:hypothetical protein